MDLTALQFKPERVRETQEAQDYLPVETLHNRFELMHPPLAWEVKGGKWLPVLSQIPFYAGLNNYDDLGVRDAEAVRTLYRHKGCTTLDPAAERLGEFQHYMCTVPAVARGNVGKYYLTIWDRPVMVAGAVLWERDTAEYDRFRAFLAESGICTMNATIGQLAINRIKASLAHMEQVPFKTDNRTRQIDALKAQIAAMEALLAGLAKPKAAAQASRRAYKTERITTDDSKET